MASACATLRGVASSPAACMLVTVRSTRRAMSPKPIRQSRNAATATSLAALRAVGAPPPARSASMAMPSAGNRSRSARSKVSRPSAARSGPANARGDAVGIGEAMGDRRAHVGRRHAGDQRAVDEGDEPVDDRLRMDDDVEPLGRDAEQEMGLDQFEPLVHQARPNRSSPSAPSPSSDGRAPRRGSRRRCARRSIRGTDRPRR